MTTTTTVSFGYKSDVGRRRETNEDSCAVLNRAQLNNALDGLMIVADGLGGRRAGEVASSLLVETISLGVLETTASRSKPLSSSDVEQLLLDTIVRANGKIMTQGRFQKRDETRGMATTCVSAIVHANTVTIGNVGDSRIYLLRAGVLRQLTEDHSEVYKEFVKGNITESEARNHRFRNQITRAVGLDPNVHPDISTQPLMDGDTLLLCSDGLTTEVPDDVLAGVLSGAPTAQDACDMLVSVALRHGGRDNITVVVMRYGDFAPTGPFDDEFYLIEEPDTDPNQEWRNETRAEDELRWSDEERLAGDELPGFEPATVSRVRAPRPGTPASFLANNALAIIGILVLGMLVEGAMMYNLHRQLGADRPKTLPVNPTPIPVAAVSLDYNPPKLVMDTPIMADILQISSKGNPIVATLDGKLQTYLMEEKKLLPMRDLIPPVPAAQAPSRRGAHGKSHADIFCDPAGNLYYVNAVTKCIETYASTGTRTNENLGKGQLTAPTRLIVDSAGAIYVIDDNRLKVLTVKAAQPIPAHPSNADY